MTIPHENSLAFFPTPVRTGNIELGPLTLAGAVRLAERGIGIGRRVPREKLFEAAWVLADDGKVEKRGGGGQWWTFSRFCKRAKVGLQELSNAIEKVLNDASATFVRPARGGTRSVASANPSGIGWPLEYAEFLCSEYGWSWDAAIHTPVATVYALYAAYRRRNGVKTGMDYLERAYAKTLNKKVEK